MSARLTWIAVLPVAALLITGCGGGDTSSETTAAAAGSTTGALTKAELIEQSDAICAEVNAAVAKVKPGSPSSTIRLADLYSGMVKGLENLGNPAETEVEYGEYRNWATQLATAEDEAKLAAERGDSAALERLEKTAEFALSAFELRAYNYGFKECSRTPNAPSTSAVPNANETAAEAEAAVAESK